MIWFCFFYFYLFFLMYVVQLLLRQIFVVWFYYDVTYIFLLITLPLLLVLVFACFLFFFKRQFSRRKVETWDMCVYFWSPLMMIHNDNDTFLHEPIRCNSCLHYFCFSLFSIFYKLFWTRDVAESIQWPPMVRKSMTLSNLVQF